MCRSIFLDHAHNHKHEKEYTIEDYKRGFTLISPKNEMRIVSQQGSSSLAFVAKNPASGWDCVVIAPKRGEFLYDIIGVKENPSLTETLNKGLADTGALSPFRMVTMGTIPNGIARNISQSGENVKRKNSIAASKRTP